MRKRLFLLILSLVLPLMAGAQRKDVMVPGGDGYKLLMHMYLPKGDGPFDMNPES